MSQPSPAVILVILIAAGAGAGLFFSRSKPAPAATTAAKTEITTVEPGMLSAVSDPGSGESSDLLAQIKLLEGQVEYLQGQVGALQDENSQLMQKLGTLGMKGVPKMEPAVGVTEEDEPPDFVGMGIELMKFRQIQSLPVPTAGVTQSEVEQAILTWLRQQQPNEEGPRFGLALTALGWIDKPVDLLPVKAALWARQLGGWYDQASGTLMVTDQDSTPGMPPPDRPLAIAFGQLLREFGGTLFPEAGKVPLTTDERLARECLLAGDAGLTRFLFSLQNPAASPASDLPSEDPDHPLNQVQAPVFVRELAMFPFRPGFEFAQTLHSAGSFAQLNAAYSRPPQSCAEIIEAERYLDNSALPSTRPDMGNVTVQDHAPYWDDSLGRFAIYTALRTYNSDEDAGQAARGWQGDRLLAYASPDHKRDHAAWQTMWLSPEQAGLFFKAMRNWLLQRYDVKATTDAPAELVLDTPERHVRLLLNRNGQGVLLLDAATADFAEAMRSTLNPQKPSAP